MIWHGRQLGFVVSFHDLAPHSWEACRQFLDDMRSVGVERVSLLVVPRWHGEADANQHDEFCAWLRECAAQGHEITLHGYTHLTEKVEGGMWQQFMGNIYTAREGEFYQINYDDAKQKLQTGLDMFQHIGVSTRGFVAPAWLLSPEGRCALRDLRFEFTTYWGGIEALQQNVVIKAPTLTFSCRTRLRRIISKRWVKCWKLYNYSAPVLRLAAHPVDLKYPRVRDMLIKLASEAIDSRLPLTYADVTDGCAPRRTEQAVPTDSPKDAKHATNV